MVNLKQIRQHIASVHNTRKLTSAMKMVAVSKLRKAQSAVVSTRPYVSHLIGVIEDLIVQAQGEEHPLLRASDEPKRAVLLVLSGDRGLCGAYNHNIVKRAKRFVQERGANYESLELIFVGRKAHVAMRKVEGVEMTLIEGAWDKSPSEVALSLSETLSQRFIDREIDEVFVLYTKFKSAISQVVVLDAVLPLKAIIKNDGDAELEDASENGDGGDDSAVSEVSSGASSDDASAGDDEPVARDYIYEPGVAAILDTLLPRAVSIHLQRSLLEASASEHGARMTAMDNATNNAGEMLDRLTLEYNRARQSSITNELIEIVSGAEAL